MDSIRKKEREEGPEPANDLVEYAKAYLTEKGKKGNKGIKPHEAEEVRLIVASAQLGEPLSWRGMDGTVRGPANVTDWFMDGDALWLVTTWNGTEYLFHSRLLIDGPKQSEKGGPSG